MRLAHRAHTSASPAQVWSVLGDPDRWPQFDLVLRRVRGAAGSATTGQHLLGLTRVWSLRIPIDVVEAVPEERLVLLVHTAPGVRELVTHELTAAVRGGTDLRVSTSVEGLFAPAAIAPLWLGRGLTARLLAARADRLAKEERRRQGAA
jgi:uncharacterized protein YndB with AHSA1/START domain